MIFLRSHILGFGKLRALKLEFVPGLNLVFAPNEGGKSTLQRFLVGMLYGQLRADLRVQRRLDAWVEPYKPWNGSEYGGILWCRFEADRELEIHRFFGREETRFEIRTATGEDITGQYEQQRNGEVLFAYAHLGMPKGLFESVGIIRENQVAALSGYESIRDRIANLAQSGDEELSIRKSLLKIQEKLDSIGSDRAPTRPYKQALDLVQSLQAEHKGLQERRLQYAGWIEERNRFAADTARLERALVRVQGALLAARRKEMAVRLQTLEGIERDIGRLKEDIDSLGARADFPAERLEELNQLAGAQQSLAKHLGEVRADSEKASADLARAEAERRELEAYGTLASGAEGEKVTEWFVTYLGISLQKDGLQKTIARLRAESDALDRRVHECSPPLKDPDMDWQRVAREAAEDEQSAAQACASLSGRIVQEKSNLASWKRRTLRRRTLASGLLLLAVAPAAVGLFSGFELVPISYAIGVGLGAAAASAITFFLAAKSAKSGAQLAQLLAELDSEMQEVQQKAGEKRRRLNAVLDTTGFYKLEDFLAAAKQCEQDRQKLADLQARLSEAEEQSVRLHNQLEDYYLLLKENLAKVGLPCSPGNLKFQIDALRANLRRFRDLDARYGSCLERVQSLKLKESGLTEDFHGTCSAIESLLQQAAVASPEIFKEECRKRQRLMELLEKVASRSREFQRLAENQTLLQWQARLQELLQQPMPHVADEDLGGAQGHETADAAASDAAAPLLPYLPTIPEGEEEERRLAAELADARENHARAVERVQQAFHNFRPLCDIEEDLGVAERVYQELETNRLALGMALETLQELARQQQEVLAPQLNAAVEQRFLRLCGRRYEEVKIDPDFQVWVRERNSGELRLAEHLSRGTQDQIYFAMRFGILDLISGDAERCPSLLDEPFAAYDRPRLSEAFEVLTEEAARRQLLLFTCREDLLDLALQRGIHIIRLP